LEGVIERLGDLGTGLLTAILEAKSGSALARQAFTTVVTNVAIILGGRFDSYNGVPGHNLVRLNPDGSLAPLRPPSRSRPQPVLESGRVLRRILKKGSQ
jgi:hypothetical protein